MTAPLPRLRTQNLGKPLRQIRAAQNLREQQNGFARIVVLRDFEKRVAHFRIGGKLLGAGVQPGIDLRVDSTKLGLQALGVALRIVDQKSRVDAEEPSQQFASGLRHVRTHAALDLREVGLAEAAAHFLLHRGGDFELGHGTIQAAKRAFNGAEGAEFVAESHWFGPEAIAIRNLYIAIRNLSREIGESISCHCKLLVYNNLQSFLMTEASLDCLAVGRNYSGLRRDCRSMPSCWHFL